jgi:hypothetical protein
MILANFLRVLNNINHELQLPSQDLQGVQSGYHILGDSRGLGIGVNGLSHMID